MKAPLRPLVLTLIVAAALGTTTGCFRLPSPLGPDGMQAPVTAPEDSFVATPSPTDDSSPDAGAAAEDPIAERDRFLQEQQLPLDGTPLVAVTPAQKQFIEDQKSYVEEQGFEWTADDESLSLALVSDACETAILNSHVVNADTLRTHVATSPLFAQLVDQSLEGDERTAAEAPIANLMVYGTTYMCPRDTAGWLDAYTEVYAG